MRKQIVDAAFKSGDKILTIPRLPGEKITVRSHRTVFEGLSPDERRKIMSGLSEEGFVDNFGNFVTRAEAFKVRGRIRGRELQELP